MVKQRKFEYEYVTLCDFGTPNRRDALGKHKNLATANRQYARLWRIYGKLHGYKVWLETAEQANKKGFKE